MKTLKFRHNFVQEILEGKNKTTWRLFDDKDLQVNDTIGLVDKEDNPVFGKAIITEIQEKKIKDLTGEDLKNHQYTNKEVMLESHRKYYGDKVDSNTIV